MKLNRYIQQLLQENEMVILPGFGAFILEHQPAEIKNDSGEIKPPSSRLTFNSQIRNNDGLLVGYVAEALRSSHFEALQKIEKERDNILYQLEKGEKVELEELGSFFYNDMSEIEFISEEDQNLSLETYGLESTSLKDEEETTEEEETIIIPPADGSTSEAPKNEEKQEQQSKLPQTEESQTEPVIIQADETTDISEKKNTEPIVESLPVEEKEEEKKRKFGWIWLLVILLPLIAVTVFILIKNKNNNETISTPPATLKQQEQAEPTIIPDTVKADTTKIAKPDSVNVEEKLQEIPIETTEKGTQFYLVGGSFKEKENAQTYMKELKEKGFEPFDMGMYGDYYIVGLGSYLTEEEASAAKKVYMENNPGSGVWILER